MALTDVVTAAPTPPATPPRLLLQKHLNKYQNLTNSNYLLRN